MLSLKYDFWFKANSNESSEREAGPQNVKIMFFRENALSNIHWATKKVSIVQVTIKEELATLF